MDAGDSNPGAPPTRENVLERTIFSAAHDAVFLMRGDRFVDCNARAEEMFGLPRAQILGKTPWDISPPEQSGGRVSEPAAREAIAKAVGGVPHRFEWTHSRPDGSLLYTEVSLNAFVFAAEKLLLAIVRDITDRKRAEQALQDSERRYRVLVESMPDIVLITDEEGNCLYANAPCKDQSGYSKDDLHFGAGDNVFIHPEDGISFDSFLRGFRQGDALRTGPVEYRFIDRQGALHWYSVSVSKIDFGGQRAFQFILRDVTQHKEAEMALQLSEERFSKAFHTSPDSVTISSAADGTVIEANEGFARMSGYSREEVIGDSLVRLGIWQDPAERERLMSVLQRGEDVRNWEVAFRTKSGEIIITELSAQLMETAGQSQILAVVRDITARKRVEAERAVAYDMIAKLKNELQLERDYLREEVEVTKYGEIIGNSPAVMQVLARIEAVAGTGASVLVTGESGVGKELVARAIHSKSPRRSRTLVRVNCAAVPKDLFESEFFGHVKGSFTGAHKDRVGRFELADRGTLFLDEVAEIPMELQGKLLRVLQEGEFERIGETRTRKVDVRTIAATNRDLKKEMSEGRFRADLYYRLSVFPLDVPPLRERRQDILPLAVHFLERACREFDRGALSLTRAQSEALQRYAWPGNIRELQNVIERAVILSTGRRLHLDLAALAPVARNDAPAAVAEGEGTTFVTVDELRRRERENIVAALEHSRWKVSGEGGAAERLGMKPTTLTYRMKVLGIRRPE